MVAVSGPTVTVAFTNYLARCFGYNDLYTTNIFVIGVVFVFFSIAIFRDNFLGLRLKVEKDRMESTMKAVVSGTSILNHTIKNEVMKITMSADLCRQMNAIQDQEVYLEQIQTSSEYLLEMTKTIQHHLLEIEVKIEEVNLADMIARIVTFLHAAAD